MTNWIQEHLLLAALLASLVLFVLIIRFLKKPEWGLYLTFFGTAILMTPQLPVVREKLTDVEVFMTLTWIALLLKKKEKQKPPSLTKAQTTSLALGKWFVIWTFISFALNLYVFPYEPINSLVETANFVYGYLMFVTVVFMVRDWDQWKNCLNAWLWGAAVVSFVGVLALTGHAPAWAYDPITHRICSTLRTENQVPSFLLPIFVAVVFMIIQRGRRTRDRWALIVLLAGIFLTSIGTGSRTSLLMLLLAAVGIIYVAFREARYRAFNSRSLTAVTLMFFLSLVLYFTLALADYKGDYGMVSTPAWKRPAVLLSDTIQGKRDLDQTRTQQMEFVWKHAGDNLVIGTGPKNYLPEYHVEEIHDTYAGILIQMGLPGLSLFLIWLLLTVHTGWRASRRILDPHQRLMVLSMVVGMGLLLLYNMTMFGLRQRNIWLLAGLLVAADSLVPRQKTQGSGPPGPSIKSLMNRAGGNS